MNLADIAIHPFQHEYHDGEYSCEGITLRQYYSGLAMLGLLANSNMTTKGKMAGTIARTAIEHADALIQTLEDE